MRCTVLESSTSGGELVYANEKTGGYGNDKNQAGTDDRCDDDEDIRRKYLPNKCNKKEATNQGAMKIDNEDIKEIIEEVYRRDKFDKEFDI